LNSPKPLKIWLKKEIGKNLLRSFIIGANLAVVLCLIAGYLIQSENTKSLVHMLAPPMKNWVTNGDTLQLKQVTGQLVDNGMANYVKIKDSHGLTIIENDPLTTNWMETDGKLKVTSSGTFYFYCNSSEILTNSQICFGKKIELGWFIVTGLFLIFFYLLITAILFRDSIKIAKEIEKQIYLIRDYIQKPHEINKPEIIISEVESTLHEINETNKKLQSFAVAEKTSSIATQIAHDIRSPLAALDMLSNSLKELPEDKRIIIKSSISRIKDIANQLSSSQNSSSIKSDKSKNENSTENLLLFPLLDLLVTEKRIEYRNELCVDIDLIQSNDSYGLFANINPVEFKRLFSNIINNAIEALPSKIGRITVELTYVKELIQLAITDNGKGIPAEILPKLCIKGNTFNKTGGSGLGLSHAFSTIQSWGGSLSINSKEGSGTIIQINLPKMKAPNWFVPKLTCSQDSTLIIMDDDQSIHQIWKGRFESIPSCNIQIRSLSNPEELKKFHAAESSNLSKTTYLMDFEIINHRESGLDLIENLGINKHSILVTSRYEEKNIRDKCEKLGVRLIPKPMSGFVPIEVLD
jgi:signal transduction histidine kinase